MTPRARGLLLLLVLALASSVGYGVVHGSVQTTVAETAAVQQAAPLARVCANDPGAAARAGADCAQAAAIVRDGVDGAKGEPGVGVTGTSIVGGRLLITYSDGHTQDVGPVEGQAGATGPEGRGIRGTTVADGRLVVTFTDDEALDLGPVVGRDGRGIASLDGSSGRLLVTLTDGDVLDAGPLPAGPRGETGEAAPVVQSVTRTYSDGSSERCVRDGGTDVDPVLRCDDRIPPAEGN
jgi:hypothetical protein